MTKQDLRYMKITLLQDFTTPLEAIDAGIVRYWKILKKYDNGDLLIERKGTRALIWAKEVEAGERHTEPNFSLPLGMHLGLELVEAPPRLSQRLTQAVRHLWAGKNAKELNKTRSRQ